MRGDYFSTMIVPDYSKYGVTSVTSVTTSVKPQTTRLSGAEGDVTHQTVAGVTGVTEGEPDPADTPVTPEEFGDVTCSRGAKSSNDAALHESLHQLHLLHQKNDDNHEHFDSDHWQTEMGRAIEYLASVYPAADCLDWARLQRPDLYRQAKDAEGAVDTAFLDRDAGRLREALAAYGSAYTQLFDEYRRDIQK